MRLVLTEGIGMIDYETALELAQAATKPLDDMHNRMMTSVYAEIERDAKLGRFQYECRYMIGNRGIKELQHKGFKVSYDSWNEVYKVKWYPRVEVK